MHTLQRKLLALANIHNLGRLKLRQIAELLGDIDLHPQKIKHHLNQLQKRGLVTVDKTRGLIERVKQSATSQGNFIAIPILGRANCGEALELAEEHTEGFVCVSRSMLKKKRDIFALRAVGSSMNRAKIGGLAIADGDFIIVDSSDREAQRGDYVVSIIDRAANVKRFYKDEDTGTITLMSESSEDFPPIYIHPNDFAEYMISGKVVQVIKWPKMKARG